jgi:uncharacterized protein YifE (UPF0438 family)
MKEPKQITYSELMKSLDQFREKPKINPLTEEQKKFLLKCRNNPKPIPFLKMAELWSKVWYEIKETTVRNKYLSLKNDR